VLTANGTANSANSEPNLTFNASTNLLVVTGSVRISQQLHITPTSGYYTINTDPLSRLTSNGDFYGELISLADVGSPTVGNVYYLSSSSTWLPTDADTAAESRNLIGIATSGSGFDRGVLIRGYFKNTSWSFTIGAPVYLSVTPSGLSSTQPTATGDIVRVVGYAIASDEIYFNPSQDWIELA
jgi:hypothetical protein